MKKFTKTQYDHFRFRISKLRSDIIDEVVAKAGGYQELTDEEMAGYIQSGTAELQLDKIYRDNGSCSHAFEYAKGLFTYPGEDKRKIHNMTVKAKVAKKTKELDKKYNELLDRYAAGMITDDEFLKMLGHGKKD
jgi:hypothetical protein